MFDNAKVEELKKDYKNTLNAIESLVKKHNETIREFDNAAHKVRALQNKIDFIGSEKFIDDIVDRIKRKQL